MSVSVGGASPLRQLELSLALHVSIARTWSTGVGFATRSRWKVVRRGERTLVDDGVDFAEVEEEEDEEEEEEGIFGKVWLK